MKANYLPHLAARVFGVPLMIQSQKLSVILEAIGPRIGLARATSRSTGWACRWSRGAAPDDQDDPDEMDDAA